MYSLVLAVGSILTRNACTPKIVSKHLWPHLGANSELYKTSWQDEYRTNAILAHYFAAFYALSAKLSNVVIFLEWPSFLC